jgi:hypothetical protein
VPALPGILGDAARRPRGGAFAATIGEAVSPAEAEEAVLDALDAELDRKNAGALTAADRARGREAMRQHLRRCGVDFRGAADFTRDEVMSLVGKVAARRWS